MTEAASSSNGGPSPPGAFHQTGVSKTIRRLSTPKHRLFEPVAFVAD